MPTKIERLEGLANHLLDGFLHLRERFAILEPMLFDAAVVTGHGSGKRSRGFLILRQSMLLTCVQDIAKFVSDRDDRTPSIANITCALDSTTLDALRERYAIWRIPDIERESDPEIVSALRRMEQREEAERRIQFDKLHAELLELHDTLACTAVTDACRKIRDKLTAHTEVRLVADKYQLLDIGTLGLKYSDLRATIGQMQRAVEVIGLLVRNASFAWDMLDRQLTQAASGFWNHPKAAF